MGVTLVKVSNFTSKLAMAISVEKFVITKEQLNHFIKNILLVIVVAIIMYIAIKIGNKVIEKVIDKQRKSRFVLDPKRLTPLVQY